MDVVEVEVVYAEPERAWIRTIKVRLGATIREVIESSGLLSEVPAVDLTCNRVGVYGVVMQLEDQVSAGDRIEVYRPLLADPKESRRRRARGKSKR